METSRLWIIAGSAAVVAVAIGITAAVVAPAPVASPTATPTATSSPSESSTPAPTPTGLVTPTPDPDPAATCQNTVTDEFLAMMDAQGWTGEDIVDQQIGPRPFDGFLDGVPEGAVVCRWAADPATPADDVVDLAWSLVASEVSTDARETLAAQGYVSSEAPEGFYLEHPDGGAYLFTSTDVRWAADAAELAFVKAPLDAG
ncbi:hypothetical protein [Microbacterium ulmi]|uniref:Uncharacterized protein n=1 Tax=Microbacterium ulmi TaxID=179095 RepID=A0A7Y2PZV6_9MICO|nr:hypothetical protein [Microbacterium ulmi]NII71333.1 hypothetical protein [Microbacterium ulmi]NNH02637.1 hypothetical protein [Microbacterium ulmi]